MPFIKKYNVDFYLDDNQIVLKDSYKQHFNPPKITGSRLGGILNVGDFSSDVRTWCAMTRIYKEEFDPIYSQAGTIIEPKIKEFVEQATGVKYIQYDPPSINYDIFKSNDIFGGIPDGEPINDQGEVDYNVGPMLEIKTSSIDKFMHKQIDYVFYLQKDEKGYPLIKEKGKKRDSWFNTDGSLVVSKDYQLQLALYCYLRNITKGIFAVAFLTVDDYMHPEQFDPSKREIVIANFTLNRSLFEEQVIKYAEKWYKDYIITGRSPKLSEADKEWFNTWINK
ncbi:MPN551 family DNA-binding protein [Ureaplasma canigenitalium]|uniref:MPN551 family DNA-binding protein n=1 Tax=Ureaplasma canigenitalium TaxID=42092 RepID=UPI0004E186A3|nr:YqaJ viral recombinase family protein [Ureaplasma canigenitalium]